jgi:hypothetical protein
MQVHAACLRSAIGSSLVCSALAGIPVSQGTLTG